MIANLPSIYFTNVMWFAVLFVVANLIIQGFNYQRPADIIQVCIERVKGEDTPSVLKFLITADEAWRTRNYIIHYVAK